MTDVLLLAFIFLLAGVIAVPIASRLGLGSVLGYLFAGIFISPLLTLLNVDVSALQHIAEFGVVMMLFLVGLELQPAMLWQMRHKLLGMGGLQVTVTTVLVAWSGLILGLEWRHALAIGLIFSLSSTAIVLQTLNEKGLLKSDGGQAGFSVLLFQDIAVIPMLALLPLLAMGAHSALPDAGSHSDGISLVSGLSGWQIGLITLSAIGLVLFAGTHLIRPLFRFIASARLRELFTATALMIVIGIALLMSLVGLSPALGTFIAGVVLANSEYRHELEADIDPFKGLLLGLFFMTVGASINFGLLFDQLTSIVLLTLALMALKALVVFLLARGFRISQPDSWLAALALAQAGEFGFVLLSFSLVNSILPKALIETLMLIVALSMLLTPVLFIFFDKVIQSRVKMAAGESDDIERKCKIIVIGHGRVGGIVNRMVRAAGYGTTVIDYSSSQLELLRKFDFKVYFGDGTRPDLLKAAGIEQAKILVIAIDDREHITNLVSYVQRTYPHVHVIARATDRTHVYDLWAVGCRDIIRETYDSSLRMGRSALEALGHSKDEAAHISDEFNNRDRQAMLESSALYKPGVPIEDNPEFVEKVKKIMNDWEQDLIVKSKEPD